LNTLSTTEHGIPINEAFAEPATEEQLQRAATTLREHGMPVEIVDTPEDARVLLEEILPRDQAIFTATSETLRATGVAALVEESGRFKSILGVPPARTCRRSKRNPGH
jgi:predicted methyltransferase MtxX (methanogen marker protein 4)